MKKNSQDMKYPVSFELEFRRHELPGKLIAIEGIDGSGKTTQAHELVQKLNEKGQATVYTKEPTDGEIGRFIREILAGKKEFHAPAFQYLFSADRVEHQEEVLGFLLAGKTIVSDRFFWSAVPYGILDRGVDLNKSKGQDILLTAFSILSTYHQFTAPDVTFYLDVPAKLALKRLSAARHIPDIYDKLEKLEKIAAGYDWLIKKFPSEFVLINGNQPEEKVTAEILNTVYSILNTKK